MPVRCLALTDLVARLQGPVAEEWSALTGTSMLVVEARAGGRGLSADALDVTAGRLAAVSCPTIALVADVPFAGLRPVLDACDVVVTADDDLAACVDMCRAAPLAATMLVQVLRAGVGRSFVDALTVESLAYAALQAGPEHARWLAAHARRERAVVVDGTPAVRIARDAERLTITLDRPARHNAFSVEMRDGLVEALALATAEPSLEVLLRGAGPSFCSGGDLDEFGTRPDPATAHLVRTTRSPARLLAGIAERVHVELHGACVGAGVELAALARHVVARPDTRFHLPEIRMGLIPGAGGTASLPRRIGRQRTAFLALSGRWLDAATAHAWGLIDAIEQRAILP